MHLQGRSSETERIEVYFFFKFLGKGSLRDIQEKKILPLLLSESETPLDAQCQKSIPDYITTNEIEENDSTI